MGTVFEPLTEGLWCKDKNLHWWKRVRGKDSTCS